jgi:hypothetical protein
MIVRRRRLIDWSLIGLAIVARVSAVLVLQSYLVPRSTFEHGEIATNLLSGHGFAIRFLGADGPTSQQAPVYPLVVALAFAIGGAGTPHALLLLELGQAVLGGVLAAGVMRLAGLIAPGRIWVARVAALVVAVHPTLVYAATHVQAAALGATLFVWTLAWAYQTGSTGRYRDAAVTGGCFALLALTDPILSLVIIGIAGAIRTGRRATNGGSRSAFQLTMLTVSIALVGISPWLMRNAMVHGEFVPIKSTFGYAFWQGNCALSEGTDKVRRPSVDRILASRPGTTSLRALNQTLWIARHEAGYLDDIALTQSDYRLLGSVSEPERSRILFRRALADLRADPARYFRLFARRLRYFVFFDETNPKSRVWVYQATHLALTAFALAGLLLASPRTRRQLMPTVVTAAAITVFHSLTIVSARFHIPLEPLMAIWGSAGIARFASDRDNRSGPAPHHVVRVGIVSRLPVVRRLRRDDLVA